MITGGQNIKDELSTPTSGPIMDDDESTGTLERAAQLGVSNGVKSEHALQVGETYPYNSDDALGDEDAEGEDEFFEARDRDDHEEEEEEDAGDESGEYESQSASDVEDDDEEEVIQVSRASRRRRAMQDDDGEEETDDGEGNEDELEEEGEGVGAVKFRPGETDDEDDDSASGSSVDSEASDDEEWEENVENADDDEDEEEEDDDDEDVVSSICLLCKQEVKQGSGQEGSIMLVCSNCAETAHATCVHDNSDDLVDNEPWKCSNCVAGDNETGAAADVMDADADTVGLDNNAEATMRSHIVVLKANSPRASPAQRAVWPNSSSATEEQTDGINDVRVLRKRKTSPAEADDSSVMSLRRRRKNATDDLSIDGFSDLRDQAGPSSIRSLRMKSATVSSSSVTVTTKTPTSLILKMRVPPLELRRILQKRKYAKRGTVMKSHRKKRIVRTGTGDNSVLVGGPVRLPMMPSTTSFTQPFYSFFDKGTDELKGKPYGGILTEAEADTSKTFPTADDRRRFDEAKQKAEEEWRARLFAIQAEAEPQQATKKAKKATGPASQIECIEFGGWEIDTWYAAPYPEEYSRNRVLYICEFCLKYMNSDYVAWRHKLKCPAKHPPGDEIYRNRSISFFEVDGRKNPVYCQNLCLLAKLFLGSKTLYYDVEPFLFYVLCEYDDFGYHFVGYFSKEKRASSQNNVSCILTLPIHQRKGYGNLLIDFSYLLTRVEKKTGSPEKPLSDMGLVSYRNYWRLEMCRYLLRTMEEDESDKKGLSIKKISDDTGMTADDVISALEGLRALVRDPQTGLYAFRVDVAYCREYVAKWQNKNYVTLDPKSLTWTPYVMGRSNASNFELGPALTAIAPREEDEEHKAAEEYIASLTNGNGPATTEVTGKSQEEAEQGVEPAAVLDSTELNDGEQTDGQGEAPDDGNPADDKVRGDSLQQSTGEPATHGHDVVATAEADGDGDIKMEDQMVARPDGYRQINTSSPSVSMMGSVDRISPSGSIGWAVAYDGIPPKRFVVYPPLTARGFNYARAAIGRPPGSRTGHGSRGRRYGYVRRSIVRTSTTGSGRKRSGGTGRGPGRWPKGTKKSDYGNAESGPGLPPGWTPARVAVVDDQMSGLGAENGMDAANADSMAMFDAVEASAEADTSANAGASEDAPGTITDANEDAIRDVNGHANGDAVAVMGVEGHVSDKHADGEDDGENNGEGMVQVQTPTSGKVELLNKRNGVNGIVLESGSGFKSRSSPRLGKNKTGGATGSGLNNGEDTVMVDASGV